MLKITTSNGDTLIHADQESDAMKFTATDGSQVVVHAGAWGRHKYIRKEGNRYIYPEDLQKEKGIKGAIDRKKFRKNIDRKDQAFVNETKERNKTNPMPTATPTRDQVVSAHQQSTAKYLDDPTNSSYVYRIADGNQQAALKKERDFRKQRGKELDQINSAHQGSTRMENLKDDIGSYKNLHWRDGEAARANKEAARERHKRNSEHVSFETETKKNMSDTKRQFDQMSDPSSKPKNLELQKKKTDQRKKAKEILDKGFESSAAEEERKKAGARPAKKRPKSRTRNVINGSVKIKKGASVKTNGPVGRR